MKWSRETIEKALRLKFACGKTGYELLLEQGQPLPSIATLRRRMADVEFETGVLKSVFSMLKTKVSASLASR